MNVEKPIEPPITIHEAKTNLSRLVRRAEAGEEIILARGSKPVAKIVPLSPPPPKRRVPGRFSNLPGSNGILDHGFWDPLPDEELGLGADEDPVA